MGLCKWCGKETFRNRQYCNDSHYSSYWNKMNKDKRKVITKRYRKTHRDELRLSSKLYNKVHGKTNQLKFEDAHPGRCTQIKSEFYKRHKTSILSAKWVLKGEVIKLLGDKCSGCGIKDIRVLQVNHLQGNGSKDRKKYGNTFSFYKAIISGVRSISDLNLLCANCNRIYEFERGHWKVYLPKSSEMFKPW